MMKAWKWLIPMALALFSCTREVEAPEPLPEGKEVEGKTVTVHFSITGPEDRPGTKVLDNGGDMDKLYVAVFGSSGYLKEYREATITGSSSKTYSVEKTITNAAGIEETVLVSRTVPVYDYSVELTLSDSPRTIHFLGNGPKSIPFGYDTAVMPLQMSQLNAQNVGEKAYWQMLELPNGIRAKRNQNGDYVDADGRKDDDKDFTGYVLDPAMESYFQEIALIRNWAKIVLYAAEDANFTPHSLAVINFPSRGAIAPYSAKTGFVKDYTTLGFTELKDMQYPANLPAGTEFDDSMPTRAEFEADTFVDGGRVAPASTKADIDNDNDSAVYLYERPAPSEKIPPTYVIIYGYYRNPKEGVDPNDETKYLNEGYYYYKVDLMETIKTEVNGNTEYESAYYPIYRNFKYQILIKKILSMGQLTPEAAAVSAGSADVSADITTGTLSDISDGMGRLHLTPWMAQTFIDERGPDNPVTELHVYFSVDTDGEANVEDGSVTVTLLPPADGGGNIIYPDPNFVDPDTGNPIFVGAPVTDPNAEDYGWRPIRFCTVAPGKTIRSQTMRISGYHTSGRLYRDVIISIQPIQPMWVECEKSRISPSKNESQSITIGIPEGLTKAMFPLNFTIEAQDLTLTPDNGKANNNLPVVYGTSISTDDGYAGRSSFQYTRNFTWEEYRSAPMVEHLDKDNNWRNWRTLTCYFKTNCSQNATKVWVKNKYFDLTSDAFTNYEFKSIHDTSIPAVVPQEADVSIPFKFSVEPMDENNSYPELTLKVRGLINDANKNTGVVRADMDVYTFVPTTSVNTLYFITTGIDGDISVEISAPGYNAVTIRPYRFNKGITDPHMYGMLDGVKQGSTYSNVAFGRIASGRQSNNVDRSYNVIFAYFADPDGPENPAITVSGLSAVTLSTTTPTTPGSNKRYHQLTFATNKNKLDDPISFSISSVGYVTETYTYNRIERGRLHTIDVAAGFLKGKKNVQTEKVSVFYDFSYFDMYIEPLDGAPAVYGSDTWSGMPAGLILGKDKETGNILGGRYRLRFQTGNLAGNTERFKNQRFFFVQFQMDPSYKPVSMTPVDEMGTCFPYPANTNLYHWVANKGEAEYLQYKGNYEPAICEKSIIVEVGTDHPVCITAMQVKPYSEFLSATVP